ncbi:MAG: uracil-DNA glycosylase [Candidatus Gastranaerophilales bacterium]|nr:uracil-DNA glycosylase [Candidatus Gastranaerophilales bacterium]
MYEKLNEIKEKCLNCKKCPLHASRTNVVFSDGVANSKLVLVGEAPGYWEDMKGLPFVGRAGQLLDKIFECVNLSRKEHVYICNTIKCRPPENRNPLPEEKEACKEYLDKQLEILKPKIILICGSVALNSLLPNEKGITRARGKWFDGPNGAKMMPIFHPSYLLRNDSREKGSPKWLMWQDIKEVKRMYDTL